jgi:hemerythrin
MMSNMDTAEKETFKWTDGFVLGYQPMDATHQEFVDIVNELLHCPDESFVGAMEKFKVHALSHFGLEDQWMRETEFPAGDCHIGEHAAVMASFEEVYALAKSGDTQTGRGFARELQKWFPGHADYLDSALAHWMFKRTHGGKPVVLRRTIKETEL